MKLIIAGSRGIKDYAIVRQAVIDSGLWAAHKRQLEIVSGMALGVDALAVQFAKRNGLVLHEFHPRWDDIEVPGAVVKYNRFGAPYNAAAGHWRNGDMAKFADALVAVWNGVSAGTKNMIQQMERLDKLVYVHNTLKERA